jgi:hypothetical protein
MSAYFLDASAILKYYCLELGQSITDNPNNHP